MKTSSLFAIATLIAPCALTSADFSPRIEIAAPATPITLLVTTGGHSPNLITVSSDLKKWEDYLNVYSRVPYFRLVDLATIGGGLPPRFYRMLVQEAQSSSAMRTGWSALGFTNYQFKFTRTCFCTPTILSGTVTVKNGQVLDVTDAHGDGLPIQNPDPSQFKSVEELFDLVEIDQHNADVFAVVFDPQLHFPTTIQIDYYAQAVDDEITYLASEVIPLEP